MATPTKPPKPPTEAEIKRQQASEARAKRNEASGKVSHQDRVAARNESVSKKNAARAKAHPQSAQDSNPMFRRSGTGSVADRLTRRDMPAKKAAPKAEPDMDHLRNENSIPAQVSDVPAGGRGEFDESKHRRHGRGREDGGRFA